MQENFRQWRGARRIQFRLVAFALLTILLTAGCASITTAPIDRQEQSGSESLTCVEYRIPVRLAENAAGQRRIVGDLCYEGDLSGKTLQVLLSGGGYGSVYYDFPFEPKKYSYVLAATSAGYATFNLDRIGIGRSSKPFGTRVTVDSNAYVVHQVIEAFRTGTIPGWRPGKIVTVGHSMGSVMAIAHAVDYPGDADGVILTGILHNTNPEYTEQVRDSSRLALFDRRFFGRVPGFTYFTSGPGMRERMFYSPAQSDPEAIAIDEATRETLTLGEIISVAQFDRERTREIDVPVLMLNGGDDFTSCGGNVECDDEAVVAAFEAPFFSDAAELEVYLIGGTGHVLNLHRTAPQTYQIMIDWIGRKVDSK